MYFQKDSIYGVKSINIIRTIDNKNLTHFINRFFVPEHASSLSDNAVKTLCAQAQVRALPEQH